MVKEKGNQAGAAAIETDDADYGSRAAGLLKCLHTKDTSEEMFRDLLQSLESNVPKVDFANFYRLKIQKRL